MCLKTVHGSRRRHECSRWIRCSACVFAGVMVRVTESCLIGRDSRVPESVVPVVVRVCLRAGVMLVLVVFVGFGCSSASPSVAVWIVLLRQTLPRRHLRARFSVRQARPRLRLRLRLPSPEEPAKTASA